MWIHLKDEVLIQESNDNVIKVNLVSLTNNLLDGPFLKILN